MLLEQQHFECSPLLFWGRRLLKSSLSSSPVRAPRISSFWARSGDAGQCFLRCSLWRGHYCLACLMPRRAAKPLKPQEIWHETVLGSITPYETYPDTHSLLPSGSYRCQIWHSAIGAFPRRIHPGKMLEQFGLALQRQCCHLHQPAFVPWAPSCLRLS